MGGVEIQRHEIWHSVCSIAWDKHDADVVCRQLGFPEAVVELAHGQFGSKPGPMWLTSVHCHGNETSLDQCVSAGWEIKKDELKESWFTDNMDNFKFYGRDMETLFSKVKIAHSRRVFCKSKEEKTKITMKDMERGLKTYLLNGADKEAEKEKKKFEEEVRSVLYM